MLNNLKILTFSYIAEHDRLTKDEKLQLGEFVKEANKDQVLNLLITGYPQSKSISEKFVKENEELVSELDKPFHLVRVGNHFIAHVSKDFAVGLGSLVLAVALISAAIKFYRNYVSDVGKKCRDIKETSFGREQCEAKVRAEGYAKEIQALKGSIKECKKTNDPSKCASKIKERITKITTKMKEQIGRVENLKRKSRVG